MPAYAGIFAFGDAPLPPVPTIILPLISLGAARFNGYGRDMRDDRNLETTRLVANIPGNISAIAAGIALFEKTRSGMAVGVALLFACMAILTIRSGR